MDAAHESRLLGRYVPGADVTGDITRFPTANPPEKTLERPKKRAKRGGYSPRVASVAVLGGYRF